MNVGCLYGHTDIDNCSSLFLKTEPKLFKMKSCSAKIKIYPHDHLDWPQFNLKTHLCYILNTGKLKPTRYK